MKLEFLSSNPDYVDLRPNDKSREWMDRTNQSFAYRCLPLNIANGFGWSFHCTHAFSLKWDGDNNEGRMQFDSEIPEGFHNIVSNTFGHGILTFHIQGIFRTPPGWDLFISGPFNAPKDGIYPLTGIFESDWSPYSFTMNWQVTRPFSWIHFSKGEPYCSIFPIPRGYLNDFSPEISPLSDQKELGEIHQKWADERLKFNQDLKIPGSDATKLGWQKNYFQNTWPDGKTKGPDDHKTKIKLPPFKKK